MQRVQHSTAVAVRPTLTPSGTVGFFRPADRANGIDGTYATAIWLNSVQEELLSVIEAAGLTADSADLTQLLKALRRTAWNQTIAALTSGTHGLVPNPGWDYDITYVLTPPCAGSLQCRSIINMSEVQPVQTSPTTSSIQNKIMQNGTVIAGEDTSTTSIVPALIPCVAGVPITVTGRLTAAASPPSGFKALTHYLETLFIPHAD